jgi:tetratricopeptide (TPR) repeat protein
MEAGEKAGAEAAAHLALAASSQEAQDYLREQAHLAHLQSGQIEEENATRRRMLKIEHASAVFKLALEVALAAVALVIVIGLGAAMWNAAGDNGLIVQSFSVPPDMAGRGLTGEVIAAKLLDKLQALQAATVSNRAPSSYANNWDGDINLQIPETGVSIGEFNRSLHAWLGHQTHITGEIWRMPAGGIAVTARAGNDISPTFTGSDADIDKLIQQAAESVYRATQPYRYAVYLSNAGRTKEAQALYQQLIHNGSPTDRTWAYIGIENIYNANADYVRAKASLDAARALKPDFVMAYINRASLEGQYQHDEATYLAMKKVVELAHGPRDPTMAEAAWEMGTLNGESTLAADLGDFQRALAFNRQSEAHPEFNNLVESAYQSDMLAYASTHDPAGERAARDALPPTENPVLAMQHEALFSLAEVLLGRPDEILASNEPIRKVLFSQAGVSASVTETYQIVPYVALAYAQKGDFKRAHATIDLTPADCVFCLRVRGDIDRRERNWGGAGYWFARAAAATPSTPFPTSDWGRMLLEKGDVDGAIAKFGYANEKGPHFADPLEGWGEALILKNRSDLALPKFEEAARYAPNWERLHQKWGEALTYLGRKDEAAKQFALGEHR